MKFDENNENVITIPKYEDAFIYFLIKDEEVVYVGQTKHGLVRPFSHTDKNYDAIKIIFCDTDKLDITEDSFIQKYKPIYNKRNNYAMRWSLKRVRNCIRNLTKQPNYNIPNLRKILKVLNITPEIDCFSGGETISFEEYTKILMYVEREKNGE